MQATSYKGHEFAIEVQGAFAYIYVDGKCQFRVKHPQDVTPQQYAREFIDRKFQSSRS